MVNQRPPDLVVVAESLTLDWPSLLTQSIPAPQPDLGAATPPPPHDIAAIEQVENSELGPAAIAALTRHQVQAYLASPIWINAPPASDDRTTLQLWGWLIIQQCRAACCWHPVHRQVLQQIATQLGAALEKLQWREHSQIIQSQTQRTEAKYQLATRACSIGIWDWDLKTNDIYLDPLLKAMLGYRDEDIRNHIDDWSQYVYTADLPQVMAAATEHLEGRSPEYRVEHRMVHRDGSLRWVLAQGTALRSPDGTPYRLVGTDIDITDRKTAELALAKQTQQERAFNEVVQAVRSSLDLDIIFREAAAAISAFLEGEVAIVQYLPAAGCWRHQVVYHRGTRQATQAYVDVPDADNPFAARLKRLEIVQVDNTATIQDPVNRLLAETTPHRAWLMIPISTAGQVWGSLTLTRLDQPLPWLADEIQLAQRVADQLAMGIHQASLYQQLRAAHERDALVLQSIGEGVWDWDPNEDVIHDSARYWKILGYDPQLQGATSFRKELDRIHPDERDQVQNTVYQHLSTGEPFRLEFRMRHRQGHYLWIRARGQAVWNERQEPVRMLGTIEDISDRKQAELQLQASEAFRRQVMELAPIPLYIYNLELAQLTYCNPAYEATLGYTWAEIQAMGTAFLDVLYHPDQRERIDTHDQQVSTDREGRVYELEYTCVRKDGSPLIAYSREVVLSRRADGTPKEILGFGVDLTEQKTIETALRESNALYEQVQKTLLRRVDQEYSLRLITQHMRESLDLDAILSTAVTEVQQVLRADRTLIFQLTSDHSGVVIQECVRPEYLATLATRWADEHFPTACYEFYRQGQGRIVEAITQDDGGACLTEFMQTVGVQSKMVAPITQTLPDGTVRVWGLLITHACATRRHWEPDELDLLQQVAHQLAIALQQSALHQRLLAANRELEHLSTTDSLTQIANRRRFDDTLAAEWQRAQREQRALALVLCDIDYFKQYNDTYGHLAGNECLVAVAQALQHCVNRTTDCVARYGGEEFAVILPHTNVDGAIVVVQHMQAAIAALDIRHATHTSAPRVTVSFGITAAHPYQAVELTDLMRCADSALYQAKQTGRDRYAVVLMPHSDLDN